MRMPGFSGEASLYSSEAYGLVSMEMNLDKGEVVPAEYVDGTKLPGSGYFPKTKSCCRLVFSIDDCHKVIDSQGFPRIICNMKAEKKCVTTSIFAKCPTGYS